MSPPTEPEYFRRRIDQPPHRPRATLDPREFFDVEGPGVEVASAHDIELTAGPSTDLFTDPRDGTAVVSATTVTRIVSESAFKFSALVSPLLASRFDAGALLVRRDAEHWAKVCLEQSVDGTPTAVSVVTRTLSDDANGWDLPEPAAWFRVSRDGEAYAFHVSGDGQSWKLLRLFALPGEGPVELGFVAQSPVGDGCRVTFSELSYVLAGMGDPRSGA